MPWSTGPWLLALLTLMPTAAQAEPALAPSETPASEVPPVARLDVQVNIVQRALSVDLVQGVVGKTLREDFRIELSSVEQFSFEKWYAARTTSPYDLSVWLVRPREDLIVLYFASTRQDRFLVRRLAVSSRLDEMDREALSQVFDWSLRALAEGKGETLSRAEAASVFPEEAAPAPVARNSEPSSPPEKEPAHAVSGAFRRTTGFLPTVGFFYGGSSYSHDVGLVHGPGARASVDWVAARSAVGLALRGQYVAPHGFADADLELSIETFKTRLELRALYLPDLGWLALGGSVGFGFNANWWSCEARDPAAFAPSPAGKIVDWGVSSGLVVQFRLDRTTRAELGLDLDFDPTNVHFDVVQGDQATPFVTRDRLRAGVHIGLEFL